MHLAARTTTPLDITGAGDAFTATLIARIAAGDGFVQAAQWANVAASLAIERVGPATCPSLSELVKAAPAL